MEDVYDSPLWRWHEEDEVLHDDGGGCYPVQALALGFCGDGVETNRGHHRKPRSIFCLGCCILNLPPWVRSKPDGCHLPMVVHKEPSDYQPYMDIWSDELLLLHEIGRPMWNEARWVACAYAIQVPYCQHNHSLRRCGGSG